MVCTAQYLPSGVEFKGCYGFKSSHPVIFKHCRMTVLLFLFGSVNPFSKQQNFSPNQQVIVVTFVAVVSLFWSTCLV